MSMDIASFIKTVKNVSSDLGKLVELQNDLVKSFNTSYKCIRRKYYNGLEIIFNNQLIVLGDLHGDFETLVDIIKRENVFKKLENDEAILLFLGDYVDRGLFQVETITAVSMLKTTYPDKVVMLRGNHEPPPTLIPRPHDFPEQLISLYRSKWRVAYRLFMRIFQKIPVIAIVPRQILFLHGGPPACLKDSKSLEEAFSLNTPLLDDEVLEDILWSDPVDYNIYYRDSYRGVGRLYGYRLTAKTLKLANVKYIIRAHEYVDGGYKFNHNGRVITVFTSKAPVYGIERVAYMVIGRDSLESGDIEKCFRNI